MEQELVQRIKEIAQSEVSVIHTAMPGRIASFDPGTGMASVQPLVKYTKPDGSKIDYPVITGVPVIFPQSSLQGSVIAFPVKAGDTCLLIVSEESLDGWLYGRESETDTKFDLSNAIAIPGLFSKASKAVQEACSTNAIILSCGSKISVSSSGIAVTGSLTVDGSITATGDVKAAGISLKDHTHTGVHGETSKPH